MAHDHAGHDHDHHHHHAIPADFSRAFLIGILLNVAFVMIEAGYGFFSNSLALLADAGHNLGDVMGLTLAWGATYLSKKEVTDRYSYGLKSSSIMAAFINALILSVAIGAIILEAIQRLRHPSFIHGQVVILVAAIGILVNGFTAYLFSSSDKTDLNLRGAFLHMLSDALISLGVVIAGFVYIQTGWSWIDPVMSIFVSILIFISTIGLLRESTNLALHGVPKQVDLKTVRAFLLRESGVKEVHDLHVWAMSTTEIAMTCHLSTHNPELFFSTGRIQKISNEIERRFGICHSTIQIDHESDVDHCVKDTHSKNH